MELETVGRISVCNVRFKVGWQIDDIDSAERTLLGANTATNAETLGDEGNLGLGGNFDTKTATSHDWAGLFAFLSAFLYSNLLSIIPCSDVWAAYLRLALDVICVINILSRSRRGSGVGGLEVTSLAPCLY